MELRPRWNCPDIPPEKRLGYQLPIPGTDQLFDECPAYGLRTASMGLPAEHLIDGLTHPDEIASAAAFELESGARSADSLSTKVLQLVHIRIAERSKRDAYSAELRRENRGKH